jgi:hypothetical protein
LPSSPRGRTKKANTVARQLEMAALDDTRRSLLVIERLPYAASDAPQTLRARLALPLSQGPRERLGRI